MTLLQIAKEQLLRLHAQNASIINSFRRTHRFFDNGEDRTSDLIRYLESKNRELEELLTGR